MAGALLWQPDVILSTPIPQLLLALEGRREFVVNTTPEFAQAKAKQAEEDANRPRSAADWERRLDAALGVKPD